MWRGFFRAGVLIIHQRAEQQTSSSGTPVWPGARDGQRVAHRCPHHFIYMVGWDVLASPAKQERKFGSWSDDVDGAKGGDTAGR